MTIALFVPLIISAAAILKGCKDSTGEISPSDSSSSPSPTEDTFILAENPTGKSESMNNPFMNPISLGDNPCPPNGESADAYRVRIREWAIGETMTRIYQPMLDAIYPDLFVSRQTALLQLARNVAQDTEKQGIFVKYNDEGSEVVTNVWNSADPIKVLIEILFERLEQATPEPLREQFHRDAQSVLRDLGLRELDL